MLTKPLTVWRCQPVASMISARVTPFGRFISAMTAAFLLLRSSFAPFCGGARRGAFDLFEILRHSNQENYRKEKENGGSGRGLGIWLPSLDTFRTFATQLAL